MTDRNTETQAATRAGTQPRTRANARDRGIREFKRAYKACILCRKNKSRCDLPLAADGIPSLGPCIKCSRERRDCQFPATRGTVRQKEHQGPAKNKNIPVECNESAPASRLAQAQGPRITHETDSSMAYDNASEQRMQRNAKESFQQLSFSHHGVMHNTPFSSQSDIAQIDGLVGDDSTSIDTSTVPRSRTQSITQGAVLNNSVMRTMIASSNDALGLLFQAAGSEQRSDNLDASAHDDSRSSGYKRSFPGQQHTLQSIMSLGAISGLTIPETLSDVSPDTLKLWNRCRFVKQGWFSAREAVTYVDLFYKNCSGLSPILTNEYADHSRHCVLVTEEPLLACTILMISSRVHTLPGMGGSSRAHFIHSRLWGHAEHLVSRVIFGQEKFSTAKTRTLGTIESFLLMTEWHPRSLHFPPHSDDWDFDLLAPDGDGPDISEDDPAIYRWREDVFEPAKRSDRMSWMILGAATTLADELGIFTLDDSNEGLQKPNDLRKLRVRRLLYVYVNQLSARIGCTTLIPENISLSMLNRSALPHMNLADQHWHSFMLAWIKITKLTETVNDMLFSSPEFTKQLLLSGRYKGLLNHFRPLLERWNEKAVSLEGQPESFRDILFIEYNYIRMYMNSLSIQAVVERSLVQNTNPNISTNTSNTPHPRDDFISANITTSDYALTAEVIDASVQILKRTISLAKSNRLKFAPVRIYLRVVSASIFLLKAISLGARQNDLQISLGVLDECIQVLQTNAIDEMHLCSRYGTLMEKHVARFRRNFVVPLRTTTSATYVAKTSDIFMQRRSTLDVFDEINANAAKDIDQCQQQDQQDLISELQDICPVPGTNQTNILDDWWAQPFDPGIAPFVIGDSQQMSGLELGSLDFLWNLPPT